jgi:hypothetical protein
MLIDVTLLGTNQQYDPGTVNDCDPGVGLINTLLLAELAALVPMLFVAVSVNVYVLLYVNPGRINDPPSA